MCIDEEGSSNASFFAFILTEVDHSLSKLFYNLFV